MLGRPPTRAATKSHQKQSPPTAKALEGRPAARNLLQCRGKQQDPISSMFKDPSPNSMNPACLWPCSAIERGPNPGPALKPFS